MTIQTIVEGHGEVEALPVLLRRFQAELGNYDFQVGRPIRRKRSELVTPEQIRRSVRLAMGAPQCAGILIVLDSDDDCPATIAPLIQQWAQAEAGEILCQVVLPKREFEAWFIAAIESLRNFRSVRVDATPHPDPEAVRDCKRALEDRMVPGSSYSPRVDQAAFIAQINLRTAYQACRSFRRMANAFGKLARSAGAAAQAWPPQEWL